MNLTDQTTEYWTEQAKELLLQTFPPGSRAVKHAMRIADNVEPRLKPIALLHDTVEDAPEKVSLEKLTQIGFPSYIVDAVGVLTHLETDSNVVYWGKIATNPDAVKVKLADISDNLSDKPSDYARQKYAKALAFFAKNENQKLKEMLRKQPY